MVARALVNEDHDITALAGALLAVLDHELHNGNDEQMNAARNELNRYLTHRR